MSGSQYLLVPALYAAYGCTAGQPGCAGSVACWGSAPLEDVGAYLPAADAGAGISAANGTQLSLLEADFVFSSLAAENNFVCGLAENGTLIACWGSGLLQELVAAAGGGEQAGQSVVAVPAGDAVNPAVKLVTGDSFVCALQADRTLRCLGGCWGEGRAGNAE